MRSILHIIGILFFSFSIFIIDLFFKNILPYPFNTPNLVFIFLMLCIIFVDSGKVVWIAFFSHTLLDIYSAHPFGILLGAGTFTFLLEYWFYRDLFTNKSIWSLIAMTASGLIIFRVIYTIALIFTEDIMWVDMSLFYMWELIFTLSIVIVFYGIAKMIFKKIIR